MNIQNLIDSSADGIFVFDKQKYITAWNKQLNSKFGISSTDSFGKSIERLSLFSRKKDIINIAGDVLKGIQHKSFHNVYVDALKDVVFYFTLVIDPVLNDENEIEGGMGTIKDVITVEKESTSYSFNDIIHNDHSLPKIAFSKNGKPISINDSYRELWGLTPKAEKFILNNYNLFQDEQLAGLEFINQIKKEGHFAPPDIPIVEYDTKKTSSIKSLTNFKKKFSGFVKTNHDTEGQFDGIEITLFDLSEENQGGFNNPWFNQKFQKLTRNLPGVIYEYVVNPEDEGYFNFISQSCLDVFGYTNTQIQSNPLLLRKLIHSDDIVSYLRTGKKAEIQFSNWEWEGRFVINNQIKWIRASSRPEKLKDGRVIRYGILTDVTSEKNALESKQSASKRLKLAIKGANLGLWDWDLTDNSFVINSRFAEMLGYSKEQLTNRIKDWKSLIHPDELTMVNYKLINHLKGNTEFLDFETRVKKANNDWLWISSKAQVTDRSADGRALRLAGTTQDINSRKQYEKILAQSEARYRGLIEYSPVAIVVYRNNKVVFANDQTYQLLGVQWEVDDMVGMDLLDFVKPEFRQRAKDRIEQVFRSKAAGQMVEETLVRMDGKEIIVEMVGIPFEDEGEPAIQIIASDVTDKITTQKILKRSEKLLTQLFDSSPIGLVLLDSTKRVVQINQGFENIFGYNNEECFGKKLNQLIIPKGYRNQAINLNSLITEGNVVNEIESVRKDKNGNLVPVMIYGVPVNLNGRVIAIYGIYVDMRASKKVEEELKVRNEELDNFVYKVSHDLRAPLSSTLGLVHLANLDENDTNLREYIRMIGERIDQLDRFIADVLSHSKNLKVEVSHIKIDFHKIIDRNFDKLDYLQGAKRVSKKVSIKGGAFFGDEWRISEVLRNLISNAIKYMDHEVDNPFIKVDIAINPSKADIIISDNGIGISEEMIPRIFEMFYRATESSEGSGIGLYIVQNAIKKMGGKIDLQSKEGEGTTFTISLPNHITE